MIRHAISLPRSSNRYNVVLADGAAQELARTANLFGYGEIKPLGAGYYGSSMITFFSQIQEPNFQPVQIQKKEDIWTAFRIFLSKDRAREDAA